MQEVFEKIAEKLSNSYIKVNSDADLEWNRAIYECAEMVKTVAAEHNNGWIPVTDRLPEEIKPEKMSWSSRSESDIVLVTVNTNDGDSFVDADFLQNGTWNSYRTDASKVVAWQPLPEKYQPLQEGVEENK